jgi:hypothetical protein
MEKFAPSNDLVETIQKYNDTNALCLRDLSCVGPFSVADKIDATFADLALRTSLKGEPFVVVYMDGCFSDEICNGLLFALNLKKSQSGILFNIGTELLVSIKSQNFRYVRPAYRLICNGGDAEMIILEPSSPDTFKIPKLEETEGFWTEGRLDETFKEPWTDKCQTDPLRVLVNRLRASANNGNKHLYEVADKLVDVLNIHDAILK